MAEKPTQRMLPFGESPASDEAPAANPPGQSHAEVVAYHELHRARHRFGGVENVRQHLLVVHAQHIGSVEAEQVQRRLLCGRGHALQDDVKVIDLGERVLVLNHDWGRREGSTGEVRGDLGVVWTIRDGKVARLDVPNTRAEVLKAAGLAD